MTWFGWIAVYLVVWWVVLFAILPLGSQSHHEAGIDPGDGGDPGAPVNPNLARKFVTTTWVSAAALAVMWAIVSFVLIPLNVWPGSRG